MRLCKNSLSVLVLLAFSLTQVRAHVSANLGGEGMRTQESRALQVQSAVLLEEDGTPRCLIGADPGKYLTAEQLEDFYATNSSINPDTFDSLRECDEGDELNSIARLLGNEDISFGIKALFISASIGAAVGCSSVGLGDFLNINKNSSTAVVAIFSLSLAASTVTVLAFPAFTAAKMGLVDATAIGSPLAFIIGAGSGLFLCYKELSGR